MLLSGENQNISGIDLDDDQPCYIYSPASVNVSATARPTKKRKAELPGATFEYRPLFDGAENIQCQRLRRELFEQAWSLANARIHEVLHSANQSTVDEISKFVQKSGAKSHSHEIPTAFIVTSPNISSHELLFEQIFCRLKSDTCGPVVLLRSVDVSSLKSVLKHLILEVLSQIVEDDCDRTYFEFENGRKLLNYDLKIIFNLVNRYKTLAVTVVLEDSEAFDAALIDEIITLFSLWRNRIPFILIFGVATSVDLLDGRISRAASRRLSGLQFEVEQTNSLLQQIFYRVIAGSKAFLRLGPDLVTALMERQRNHTQSIQAFIASLKFAYMCHYYSDALSIFSLNSEKTTLRSGILQNEHFMAVRMLSSFRSLIEDHCKPGSSKEQLLRAKSLLTDDDVLFQEIEKAVKLRSISEIRLLQALHVLIKVLSKTPSIVDLYLAAYKDGLFCSSYVLDFLDSIKRMTPRSLIDLISTINELIHHSAPDVDLDSWNFEQSEFVSELSKIRSQILVLEDSCSRTGKVIKSSYVIHNKSIRTTVVAQKVQLSYDTSTLSTEDKEFTCLVDKLSELFTGYFSFPLPRSHFLNEAWTLDSLHRYHEVFTPNPRATIERALSSPSDYLDNCSSSKIRPPSVSILYRMYLESGSLINVSDLWNSFAEAFGVGTDETVDERDVLVSFYQALADLKMLGMIKQSKRKADHLSKLLWKGL